ncbi:hypothetical protein NM208_g6625 [Fusarium decemcellulare]|uniref:Uncharacterized protein n=1 Tax=Fusarium decemcellulare TaxID=57161 RepID=A0ACC1SCD6_9HYPO|nr:hypothetical protein NM208_g6625 [Fusarium decemcellulare]
MGVLEVGTLTSFSERSGDVGPLNGEPMFASGVAPFQPQTASVSTCPQPIVKLRSGRDRLWIGEQPTDQQTHYDNLVSIADEASAASHLDVPPCMAPRRLLSKARSTLVGFCRALARTAGSKVTTRTGT